MTYASSRVVAIFAKMERGSAGSKSRPQFDISLWNLAVPTIRTMAYAAGTIAVSKRWHSATVRLPVVTPCFY